MHALLFCLVMAGDAGVSAVDASPLVINVQSSSAAAPAATSAAPAIDAGKIAVPELPAPQDSEVPGILDQFIKAVKSNQWPAAAGFFALLVLWAIKKYRTMKKVVVPTPPSTETKPTESEPKK